MKKALGARRVFLDEAAVKSLETMMASLQEEGGPHLKLHLANVASWVVSCFQEKYFEKERGRMVEAHMDKEAALISLIEGLEEQGGIGRLDALLKLAKPKTEKRLSEETVTNSVNTKQEGGPNGTSEC